MQYSKVAKRMPAYSRLTRSTVVHNDSVTEKELKVVLLCAVWVVAVGMVQFVQ